MRSHTNSDPARKFEGKGHKDVFGYITSFCAYNNLF